MKAGRREEVVIERNTPFVTPRLRTRNDEEMPLRCVLDTGYSGRLLMSQPCGARLKRLSDPWPLKLESVNGATIDCEAFMGKIQWLSNEWQEVDVTIMDPCPDPLLGMPLLRNTVIVLCEDSGHVEPKV